MLYPIILAGGAGTRLWPISTKGKPKQIYPLLDDETLLQKTWKRLRQGFPAQRILLSTSFALGDEVCAQLKGCARENLVTEPARRGTAPALGLALLKLWKRASQASFVYINADNYIANEQEFIRLVRVAEKAIAKKPDHTVLIGVNPTYPEPGLGYIKMGKPVMRFPHHHQKNGRRASHGDEIFEVEKFVEKPDLKTAKAFLKSWRYLWNPTLIIARVDHFLDLYKTHLPKMWERFEQIIPALGTPQETAVIAKEFPQIEAETIDYGILEKEAKMLVLPGNFGWTDVGNWRTVHEVLGARDQGLGVRKNICKAGKCVSVDSQGNLIYSLSGKLVALAGVKNMILIESENALLLCPKGRAQDVKKLVENLEKQGLKEYL